MWMAEACDQAGLLAEALDKIRLRCGDLGKHLDRNGTLEVVVKALVDGCHPAPAKDGLEFIGADPRAQEIVCRAHWYGLAADESVIVAAIVIIIVITPTIPLLLVLLVRGLDGVC